MNTVSIAHVQRVLKPLLKIDNFKASQMAEKLGETRNAPAAAKRNTSVAMGNDPLCEIGILAKLGRNRFEETSPKIMKMEVL